MDSKLFHSFVDALNSKLDKLAITHVIRILRNVDETALVRGRAAETLMCCRKKLAMRALVELSTDPYPEVRFWCVFSLGRYVKHRKTPRIVVLALEQRLLDNEYPATNGYWPIKLEALAQLRSYKKSRKQEFRETILSTLRDPISNHEKWQWVNRYWDSSEEAGHRPIFDEAVLKICKSGYDPASFGRSKTGCVPYLGEQL